MKRMVYILLAAMLLGCTACGKENPSHDELIAEMGARNRERAEKRQKFMESDLNLIYKDIATAFFKKALPDRELFSIAVVKDVPSEEELSFESGDPEQAYEQAGELFRVSNCRIDYLSDKEGEPLSEDEKKAVLQTFADNGFKYAVFTFPDGHTKDYYIHDGEVHIEIIPEV